MSKLFEEAIADAKKLKEVAEENAKKAILESVTPQIREFIEEQLLEEKDEVEEQADADSDSGTYETDNPLDEEVYLDESALASLVELIGEDNLLDEIVYHVVDVFRKLSSTSDCFDIDGE